MSYLTNVLILLSILTFNFLPVTQQKPISYKTNIQKQSVLLKIDVRGGRCRTGECFTKILIDKEGNYKVDANFGKKSGKLEVTDLTELESLLTQADFKVIKAKKFTGDCPTSFDGQEFIYSFRHSGKTEVISSCKIEIDYESPLFSLVQKIYSNCIEGM